MELQVGVKVLLKNREGKFLLLQKSLEKYPEMGDDRWDMVGGRINPGTSLIENLRREIKEETGLDLGAVPRLIAAQDILRVPGRHVVRLTYVATIDGEPTLDEDHDAYKWLTLDELRAHPEGTIDRYLKELLDHEIPLND